MRHLRIKQLRTHTLRYIEAQLAIAKSLLMCLPTVRLLREKRARVFSTTGFEFCNAAIEQTDQAQEIGQTKTNAVLSCFPGKAKAGGDACMVTVWRWCDPMHHQPCSWHRIPLSEAASP
ncbi:hypothetical protein BS78_01G293000 [Paspalum vaginatum]|nr:hypothetical protein BS78_01G293000 [Paspalum vaginatum]